MISSAHQPVSSAPYSRNVRREAPRDVSEPIPATPNTPTQPLSTCALYRVKLSCTCLDCSEQSWLLPLGDREVGTQALNAEEALC